MRSENINIDHFCRKVTARQLEGRSASPRQLLHFADDMGLKIRISFLLLLKYAIYCS